MGTNATDMGYIKDTITYSKGFATTQGCYVTGKPVILHEVKKHDGGFAIDFLSQADYDALKAKALGL